MPTYKAPTHDFEFLLKEYFNLADYADLPGYAEAPELVTPLLDEAARFCEQELQPLNMPGDAEGVTYQDGEVTLPKGFKEAYQNYVEGGWPSFTCHPDFGGQGLPEMLNIPVVEMICGANLSFGMTAGLSHGAYTALKIFGSDEQKQTYLPKIVTGEWSGIMCLTEPQAGTDLGLIRTQATDNGDGSYSLEGGKIFISQGEQDLTENIVHLVLARLPDAPAGVNGISLFVTSKYAINADGSLGERNAVRCEGVEEKMGLHASPTCVMQYNGCKAWLVGEANKGLKAMFTMMNEARLWVGIQGLGLADVAYQNAYEYTKERLQGRQLKGGPLLPNKPADPIVIHPDVRRMLLEMKSVCEGMRTLAVEAGLMLDVREKSADAAAKEAADDWIQLMTPIIKAYMTDMGWEVSSTAIQCLGGYGYIKEYGIEQFARDARIAMIYEGTNGIQALDLIGRKLPYKFGRYLKAFFHPCAEFVEANRDNEQMAEFTKPLYQHLKMLQQTTLWMVKTGLGNPNDPAAGATSYLRMFALTVMAYIWAKQAKVALEKLADSGNTLHDAAFYEEKLATARFFMQKVLPEATGHAQKITNGSKTVIAAGL